MSIFSFFKKLFSPPVLRAFPLRTSPVKFSLDRLTRGVDNIRYDVFLSPDFCKSVSKLTTQAMAAHTHSDEVLNLAKASNLPKEREEFRRLCHEVMLDAINKAKMREELQIDYLAQAAIVKLLTVEIRNRYEEIVLHFKNVIREYAISNKQEDALQLKEELSGILERKKTILFNVTSEMFHYLLDVQNKKLRNMRESNFGEGLILQDHIFSNPLLHAEDQTDDFFMIREYDLILGHRVEDPDKYEVLISLVRNCLREIDEKHSMPVASLSEMMANEEEGNRQQDIEEKISEWICHMENADILFNYFQSGQRVRALKKQGGDAADISETSARISEQKKMLRFFYRKFKKKELLQRIVALYEMQPIYLEYCPPLVPQLVLQFLISPKARKGVSARLKRVRKYYNKSFSLRPLRKLILRLEKVKGKTRKTYLIRFLSAFFRYHRDFQNFTMIREAMDSINLVTKEKIIALSRANNTLYEFLLPHEQEAEEKPVISHVIIKADVRGSTDIVHKMKQKGLNPATYFSLNFFDPITDILPDYRANKVCIEGDAYILSIYERENAPEGWYSVARACGLALNMLTIIRRCNAKNKKYQLPELELGIGITYRDSAPTIFFDGDNQIMISSAINLADRLSGCSKPVRKKMAGTKRPFNLYVFQAASDKEVAATADDLSLRYNVNGIELSKTAFEKLSREIDLQKTDGSVYNEKQRLYTGKFPTVTGMYQRLIIREARIPRVDPETLKPTERTSRKYYEVCTNPKLYEYMKNMGN